MSLIPISSLANGVLFATQTFASPLNPQGVPVLTPAVGSSCEVYFHGTTTPAPVWSAENGVTPLALPVVADATGAVPGYIDPTLLPLDLVVALTSGSVTFVLANTPGALPATVPIATGTPGAPITGTWAIHQAIVDSTGAVWSCTAGGTPGTWVQGVGGGTIVSVDGSTVSSLSIDSTAIQPADIGALALPPGGTAAGAVPTVISGGTIVWLVPGVTPTTPGTPVATGQGGSIALTWAASTDVNGISGYNIYRSDAPTVSIGTSQTASYTDTTAVVGTSYTYTVAAFDPAGTLSSKSASSNSAAANNQIVLDSFTGTAGTALPAHVGETGATWTNASNGSVVLTNAGRVRSNGTVQATYLASGVPPSANYTVEADLFFASLLAGTSAGIGLRGIGSPTFNAYVLRYSVTSAIWTIQKITAGTVNWNANNVQLGSSATGAPPTVGSTHHLALVVSGTSLSAFLDSSLVIGPVTDAAISAVGSAGMFFTGAVAATDSTGVHIDNFSAHT